MLCGDTLVWLSCGHRIGDLCRGALLLDPTVAKFLISASMPGILN